jgi:hypothetical protein
MTRYFASAALLAPLLAPGCMLFPDEQKASSTPSKEPSSQADNEGKGGEGQQTDNSDDGGSADSALGGDNIVYVVNFADEDVCYLYLALDGDWSDDVLGDFALPMDYYYWITGVPDGFIEVYAEGCEGGTWYGADELASDYTFFLYGGGSGGGDTGDWDTGF